MKMNFKYQLNKVGNALCPGEQDIANKSLEVIQLNSKNEP